MIYSLTAKTNLEDANRVIRSKKSKEKKIDSAIAKRKQVEKTNKY